VTTFGERIKSLREFKGLTQAELGNLLGKSENTIWSWEKNKNKPHINFYRVIAEKCIASEQWLRTGEGEMLFEPPPGRPRTLRNHVAEYNAELPELELGQPIHSPIIAEINAEYLLVYVYKIIGRGGDYSDIRFEEVSTMAMNNDDYFEFTLQLKVLDDSMEKLIMQDAVIAVNTTERTLVDKKTFCFLTPTGFITRIVHTELDSLVLEPYNKQYESREIEWEKFNYDTVLGRVVNINNPVE